MKRLTLAVLALLILFGFWHPEVLRAADPLRVFIRSGPKSHGPGAHDHPAFLRDWVPLLKERGCVVDGGDSFPTKEQLQNTDVLIIHRDEGGNVEPADRENLAAYLKRGGGIASIHAGNVSRDHDWYKSIIGGSWHFPQTKWREGPMHLYFTDRENPITRGCSNFAMDDEIYYDMDVLPEVKVIAGAYTPKPAGARNDKSSKRAEELTKGGKEVSIYDIQPQMWMYEKDNYRAFVCIPGHYYANFNRPNFRAILLRGIAWAGKRANVDELCKPEELGDNLRYVEGGPTRPEKAAALLEVHPDFDISLVAAEPLINKAMNVDWDPKGRMWVCETPEYPNGRRIPNVDPWKDSGSLLPYNQNRDPQDRISILTDTDGDGRMDQKKVFADKLELVTSFCFYKNGVIACSAPDIWYLEDTDGDEICDKRTRLYTGLGINDTHAVINNLRWGLDGWVYATHGYSAGEVTCLGDKAPADPVHIGSGVVRFKPDGSAIEMFSSRNGNTWGLNITWDGQVFWTQPTSGTVFFHTVLPESILAKGKVPGTNSWNGMITGQKTYPLMSWPEQAYVQIDQVGNFTAAAGCAIYEGGAWPDKWNYSYFTCEPTINIVHHEFVRPDGVTYRTEKEKGREETEFIRSKDLWFRPIEARVGPDGALYVVDFYNQAVIHNDTRGPMHGPANAAVRPDRDHYFGRIWRIQNKNARKLTVPVLNRNDAASLEAVIKSSPNAAVKEQAWRLVRETEGASGKTRMDLKSAGIEPRMKGAVIDLYTRLVSDPTVAAPEMVSAFAAANEDWSRSAVIAAAVEKGIQVETIAAALTSANPEKLHPLVAALMQTALADGRHIAGLLDACVAAGAGATALKLEIMQAIAHAEAAVESTPALIESLRRLIAEPSTSGAALPLARKFDKGGALSKEIAALVVGLTERMKSNAVPIPDRAAAAGALVAAGGGAEAPAIALLSSTQSPPPLQSAVIRALDANGNAAAIVEAFPLLKPMVRQEAFDAILKRPNAALALLRTIQGGGVNPADLGPGNVARLRTHPNKNVAHLAAELMDKLSPQTKQKNELIARLTPEVEKQGNANNGKMLFTATCAVCHKLGDVGMREVGPPLTGMGAHGPAELLVHIVDPNREVDPSFWQWNITTKKGDTLMGVITSENASALNLRNQTGDYEIKLADIASRENTHRSLMPEGLEALGPEALRDILTFVCGGDQKYRVIDLRSAYTADSRRGIFRDEDSKDESITLHRFGNVTVRGVPFFIIDPARSPNGASVVALKGGGKGTAAAEFPQRVEIPIHTEAASLHFLGGVAGWGWPFGGEAARGKPAMKVTVTFADGDRQIFTLDNGEYFADYIGHADVPMSQDAGDFTRRGQLRYFALNLTKKAMLKSVSLESFDNGITPCTVAITAGAEPAKVEILPAKDAAKPTAAVNPKAGGKGDAPLPVPTQPEWQPNKKKILIIGGGSSHDFGKFFGGTDAATLKEAGFTVHYTEDREQAAAELKDADAAVISVNRKFFDTPEYRKALMDFVAAGKGLVMLHPGVWYGYPDWPELNAKIIGGGARSHDKIHPFQVRVLKADHPVMKDVPAAFSVEDELYHVNAEADKIPAGTAAIEVLAETEPSQKYQKSHPSVWVTKNGKAHIVGLALGHDARVHDLPAFRTILVNAVKWAAEK